MTTENPFKLYKRTKVETKLVAEVTEENIGEIAKIAKVQVDYSGDSPEIIVPMEGNYKVWRVKVGWHVSMLGGRIQNANGFNYDEDWKEIGNE